MKIFTHGGKCEWCQLPRIESSFRLLGHDLVLNPSDADLIYSNNPWWDDLISLKDKGLISGKMILNVLDIPLHILHEFDTRKLKKQLGFADSVTTISKFTKEMLVKYCGIDSEIIYQPIMDVSLENGKTISTPHKYKYSFIGRKYDGNKRVGVGVHALWLLGVKGSEVAMVGPEMVQWGTNLGLLDLQGLHDIYKTTDFVLCLGRVEGLNLPLIEAIAAGAIPVICNDMTTRQEFLPSELFPEYDNVEPTASSIAMFIAQFQQDTDRRTAFLERLRAHYLNNLSDKFRPENVAIRILNKYNSIK